MGLGAVTAIVDSLVEIVRNQASIHLCFDVALQFIELLVTAGAKDAEVCRLSLFRDLILSYCIVLRHL